MVQELMVRGDLFSALSLDADSAWGEGLPDLSWYQRWVDVKHAHGQSLQAEETCCLAGPGIKLVCVHKLQELLMILCSRLSRQHMWKQFVHVLWAAGCASTSLVVCRGWQYQCCQATPLSGNVLPARIICSALARTHAMRVWRAGGTR